MSNSQPGSTSEDRDHQELLCRYVDGTLPAEEHAALQQLLKDHPEYGRQLFELADQRLALCEALASEPAKRKSGVQHSSRRFSARQPSLKVANRRRKTSWTSMVFIVGSLAACVVLAVHLFTQKQVAPASLASLDLESAVIRLQRGGAELSAAPGMALFAEDTLNVDQGSARVRYADGTAVTLLPNTAVRLVNADGAKRLELRSGSLKASVAAQPIGKAMEFSTTHGHATVLGTELSLAHTAQSVWLEVQKGKVRLTGADNKSVDVPEGEFAVAGAGIALESRRIPKEPQNLTLRREATASSNYETTTSRGRIFAATHFGNDGDLNTMWACQDMTGKRAQAEWWQVDLGVSCLVERIELVSRQDNFDQPLARANIEIRGSNNADGSEYEVLAKHTGDPFPRRGEWISAVSVKKAFRYLRVVQLNFGHSGFAEFRAFGCPWSGVGEPPAMRQQQK
ncbi:MAG TPA: FecR domain-containing protein [Planctomycetota bacterium]|nr:FecR domain-containing protein [Planctomycetota bacterium]